MGLVLSLALSVLASSSSFALTQYGGDCDALLGRVEPGRVATEILEDAEARRTLAESIATLSSSQLLNWIDSRHDDVSNLRSMRTNYAQLASGARRMERKLEKMHGRISYFVGLGRLDMSETEIPRWRRAAAVLSMVPLVVYTVPISFLTLSAQAKDLGVHPELVRPEVPKDGAKLRHTLEKLSVMAQMYREMALAAEDADARIDAHLDAVDARLRQELLGEG